MSSDQDHFIVLNGSRRGEKIMLAGLPLVIGRMPPADIVFASEEISRRHARIYLDAIGYMVEDLGSRNGTFLNNKAVSKALKMETGDILRLGVEVDLQLVLMPALRGVSKPAQPASTGNPVGPPPEATILQERLAAASFGDMLGTPFAPKDPPKQTKNAPVSRDTKPFAGQKDKAKDEKRSNDDTAVNSPELAAAALKASRNVGLTIMAENIALPSGNVPQLVVTEPGKPPRVFLLVNDRVKIGRLPENDLVINNSFVSRHHADLEKRGNDYFLIPVPNISNALLVGGDPVTGPVCLRSGMQISMGGWGPGEMIFIDFVSAAK